MSFGMQFSLLYLALLLVCGWLFRKRVKRNRRKGLRAPDPKCIVGESWRTHTQQNHRYSDYV